MVAVYTATLINCLLNKYFYMKKFKGLALSLVAAATLFMAGCDKTKEYPVDVPPSQAHFMNKETLTYQVLVAGSSYKIPVGVTTASNVDRQITVSITSPTGATAGNQYTVVNNVVTIPAGKVVDTLVIKGNLAQYLNDQKDTLVLTITEPNIAPSDYNKTLKLVLRGPCFEGNVNMPSFLGNWRATETFNNGAPYGPYATSITSSTLITPTTGVITVTNLWDSGWEPISFLLDWTNPNSRTCQVISDPSIAGSNAGDLNAAYAGQTIAVIPLAGNPGTFSACSNTFTLRMNLGVTGLGYFNVLYEVKLKR